MIQDPAPLRGRRRRRPYEAICRGEACLAPPRRPPCRRAAAAVLSALLLGLAGPLVSPPPAEAQFSVFDAANFSQNVLTAVRTAEAILQRIEMIKNQIHQIEWMLDNVRDLEDPTIQDLLGILGRLHQLLARFTRAAIYTLEDLDELVETVYPAWEASTDIAQEELRRFETTLETAKAVLSATREIAQGLPHRQAVLRQMEEELLSTDGLLEAAQSNGLIAAAAAQETALLNQQTALRSNLEAVVAAHEVSTQARALATFTEAVRASRVEVGPYSSFAPLPVIPALYPRNAGLGSFAP